MFTTSATAQSSPSLSHERRSLEPRTAIASVQAGNRDQEVLGEELGLSYDDEDEADTERNRTGEAAAASAEGGCRKRVGGDAERDVEAADERRRRELEQRT